MSIKFSIDHMANIGLAEEYAEIENWEMCDFTKNSYFKKLLQQYILKNNIKNIKLSNNCCVNKKQIAWITTIWQAHEVGTWVLDHPVSYIVYVLLVLQLLVEYLYLHML